jgi:hypothetical protein
MFLAAVEVVASFMREAGGGESFEVERDLRGILNDFRWIFTCEVEEVSRESLKH